MSTFRTKSGVCELRDGAVNVRRTGMRGALSQLIFGSSIHRVRITYGFAGAICAGFVIFFVSYGQWVPALIWLAATAGVAYLLAQTRGLSTATHISFETIHLVESSPPRGRLRGYFIVHHQVGDKVRRRVIILSSLTDPPVLYRRACDAFEQAGLPVNVPLDPGAPHVDTDDASG